MFLTADEVAELTGRRRRDAQVVQLRALGIAHRQRADGSLVVLRAHVEQVLGAAPAPQRAQNAELNWSA